MAGIDGASRDKNKRMALQAEDRYCDDSKYRGPEALWQFKTNAFETACQTQSR